LITRFSPVSDVVSLLSPAARGALVDHRLDVEARDQRTLLRHSVLGEVRGDALAAIGKLRRQPVAVLPLQVESRIH
jgi:hypothetical protein